MKVFYRMWFGIILFGMANGFLLLPVLLSYFGPTKSSIDHSMFEEEQELKNEQITNEALN